MVLRIPCTAKLEVGAKGPVRFVKYTRGLGVTAIIEDAEGKQIEVAIANLLPLAVGTWLCSMAPVFDAPGKIAGDLSSDN